MRELPDLRRRIDEVDRYIVGALADRLKLVEKVGAYKSRHGLQIDDEVREADVYENIHMAAIDMGVDVVSCRKVFAVILSESRAIQKRWRLSASDATDAVADPEEGSDPPCSVQ